MDSGDKIGVLVVVVEFDLERSGVVEPLIDDLRLRRSFLTEESLVNNLLGSLASVLSTELYGDILLVRTEGRVGSGVNGAGQVEGEDELGGFDKEDIFSGLSKLVNLSGNSKGDGEPKVCCRGSALAVAILYSFF